VPSRDALQDRVQADQRRDPHLAVVTRVLRLARLRVELAQPRGALGRRLGERGELGQQRRRLGAAPDRIERTERLPGEPGLPLGIRGQERVQVLSSQRLERVAPALRIRVQLLAERRQLFGLRLELCQRARARKTERPGEPVEAPDLGLPRRGVGEGLAEQLLGAIRGRSLDPGGEAIETPLEQEVARAERDVGRAIREEDLAVRIAQPGLRAQCGEHPVGVADVLLAGDLGVAARRLAIRRRREVPADVPTRESICAVIEDRIRKRPGVALRHQHDDAHAGIEQPQEPSQLSHVQLLAPKRDRVVGEIVAVLLAVVGHVEEERVARPELLSLLAEPGAQRVHSRGPQLEALDLGVDVHDRRPQRVRDARREQPEIGRKLAVARRKVGLRVLPVGAEDRDARRLDAGFAEQGDHAPYAGGLDRRRTLVRRGGSGCGGHQEKRKDKRSPEPDAAE
jgi:hypothetical protein